MDRLHGIAKAGYTVAFLAVARALISRRRRWLERWNALDAAARATERDRLLVDLYRFAWDHVPFYRRLYEGAGLARGDVAGLGDLGRLPTVSKAMLRAAPLRDLRPPRWRAPVLMRMTTSGSSGAPFTFYRSLDLLALNGAQLLAYLDRWGVPSRRSVMFVLYNTDPTIGLPIREGTVFTPFSSVGSTDPRLDVASIAAHLERQRPDCLVAYPHVVEDLADHLARSGRRYPRDIVIATGAEVVSDRLRRTAAAAFPSGRLFDMYNAVETGMMAAECVHGTGRHVNDYAVVLEDGDRVVDADGTAYVAPVLTNLWNHGTPIIRYTGIEDLLEIAPSGCACGRGARSIARVVGRRSEFVHRPDGKSVSVTVLGSAHADLVGVARFQYVQADPAALVFRYVPVPGADRALIARQAEAAARRHLGTAVRFSCEAVAAIPADPATLKTPLLARG